MKESGESMSTRDGQELKGIHFQRRSTREGGNVLVFGVNEGGRVAGDAHGAVLGDNRRKLDASDKTAALAVGDGIRHQQLVVDALLRTKTKLGYEALVEDRQVCSASPP
jgi:hypothetical protein